MKDAIFQFPIQGTPVSCESIKSGHINETYLITTDSGDRYILQWVNQYVFPKVDAIMRNVSAVNSYLAATDPDKMAMIRYIDTLDGKNYYNDAEGGVWRLYRFVEHSLCLQKPEREEDFCESGRAFGYFQYALRDFPAAELEETIENFHNTPDRYRQFREAIAADPVGRVSEVREEIDFILSREEEACALQNKFNKGHIPIRVTHNDTKLNNVLLHEETRKAICVIDLDTVMPGLAAYDFGDAIRFGASTAAEDEKDLSKVHLDMDLFTAFTRGFLETCTSLWLSEAESLVDGVFAMTIECGMRFLTDYINGDKYFSIDRPEHNLDRARAQLALVRDMERLNGTMRYFVRGVFLENREKNLIP